MKALGISQPCLEEMVLKVKSYIFHEFGNQLLRTSINPIGHMCPMTGATSGGLKYILAQETG